MRRVPAWRRIFLEIVKCVAQAHTTGRPTRSTPPKSSTSALLGLFRPRDDPIYLEQSLPHRALSSSIPPVASQPARCHPGGQRRCGALARDVLRNQEKHRRVAAVSHTVPLFSRNFKIYPLDKSSGTLAWKPPQPFLQTSRSLTPPYRTASASPDSFLFSNSLFKGLSSLSTFSSTCTRPLRAVGFEILCSRPAPPSALAIMRSKQFTDPSTDICVNYALCCFFYCRRVCHDLHSLLLFNPSSSVSPACILLLRCNLYSLKHDQQSSSHVRAG